VSWRELLDPEHTEATAGEFPQGGAPHGAKTADDNIEE